MVKASSYEDPQVRELVFILVEWINDELADSRIIVTNLIEDLYDGQILQKLFGTFFVFFFLLSLSSGCVCFCNLFEFVTLAHA